MIERQVARSGKDIEGDITSLCGDWGSAPKTAAIHDIEHGTHRYYVEDADQRQATIRVYLSDGSKHLRSDPDTTCSDNLDNLPNC